MCIQEYPEPDRRDEQVGEMSNQALRELVSQCLQTNPDDRPDMTELIGKLEQLSEVLRESCHIFKEGNVSFNTKDFFKQLEQSHTFQYVSMSRRAIGISQSKISFSSWRVIRLYDFFSFFGFPMFLVFFLKLQYLYNTYGTLFPNGVEFICGLFTAHAKKNSGPLTIRIVFCTCEIC